MLVEVSVWGCGAAVQLIFLKKIEKQRGNAEFLNNSKLGGKANESQLNSQMDDREFRGGKGRAKTKVVGQDNWDTRDLGDVSVNGRSYIMNSYLSNIDQSRFDFGPGGLYNEGPTQREYPETGFAGMKDRSGRPYPDSFAPSRGNSPVKEFGGKQLYWDENSGSELPNGIPESGTETERRLGPSIFQSQVITEMPTGMHTEMQTGMHSGDQSVMTDSGGEIELTKL